MRLNAFTLSAVFAATAVLFSCKKESEQLSPDTPSAYVPAQAGKYITYRTDSTVFVNFGRVQEVHYYQEKHQVDAAITDNLGRKAYRVFRFLRDSAGLTPWRPSGSFLITPTETGVETTEDNLRMVRLAFPLRQDFNWKGNRFLPDEPFNNLYNFSNDDNMEEWDFTYTGINETLTLRGRNLDSVVTVEHINESLNVPVAIPGAYGFINYSREQYARSIGLIQQELVMWEYQPNPGGSSPYRTGFGIKRVMIDHN